MHKPDKIYKRRFEFLTQGQLNLLLKRVKQKKYRFTEHWVEVEEVTGQLGTNSQFNNFDKKKPYFNAILFYKTVDLNKI